MRFRNTPSLLMLAMGLVSFTVTLTTGSGNARAMT